MAPALLGGAMPRRPYFYWELHEPRFMQAVRFDDWKAVRPARDAAVELYDLKADPAEKNNLATDRPDIVAKAETLLKEARVDSPDWPVTAGAKKKR